MPSLFISTASSVGGSPSITETESSERSSAATAPRAGDSTRLPRETGLFLRLKERCLLPDYRIKSISGASFEGFYYAHLEFDPSAAGTSEIPRSAVPPPNQDAPLPPHVVIPFAHNASGESRDRPTSSSAPSHPPRNRSPTEPPGLTRTPALARRPPPAITSRRLSPSALMNSATRSHTAYELPNFELDSARLSGFYFHVVRGNLTRSLGSARR